VLPRRFFARDSREVAPELLNKVLVHGRRAVRIVEVEAYAGGEDPGSHAYRGRTPRTAVMFGPPGHLYVYFTYGMHWCSNVVCGLDGQAGAVLLRAGEPLADVEGMERDRPAARRRQDLTNGPAKLCQALGIDGALHGADLLAGGDSWLLDDGTPPPSEPGVSTRIGLTAGHEHPWRWYVPDSPFVSRGRLGPRRPSRSSSATIP
jgi:DNA-3-methyladenine glycosylase